MDMDDIVDLRSRLEERDQSQMVQELRAENERLRAELFHSGHHISHVEMLKDAAEADRDELLDAMEGLFERREGQPGRYHDYVHPLKLRALLEKHGRTP